MTSLLLVAGRIIGIWYKVQVMTRFREKLCSPIMRAGEYENANHLDFGHF